MRSTAAASSSRSRPPPQRTARTLLSLRPRPLPRPARLAAGPIRALGSRTTSAPSASASPSGSRPGTKKAASAPASNAFRTPRTKANTCAGESPIATRSPARISAQGANASADAARFSSVSGTAFDAPTLPEE